MEKSIRFTFGERTDFLILCFGRGWQGKFYCFWAHNTLWKNGSFIMREVHDIIGRD